MRVTDAQPVSTFQNCLFSDIANISARNAWPAKSAAESVSLHHSLKAAMGWEMPWYNLTESFDKNFRVKPPANDRQRDRPSPVHSR